MTGRYKHQLATLHGSVMGWIMESDAFIRIPPKGSADERMEIYKRGYSLRLQAVVGDAFPAFTNAAGKELAEKIFSEYCAVIKSTTYNIDRYPDLFPEFLRNRNFDKEDSFAYELALLEATINRCFLLPAGKFFNPESLAGATENEFGNLKLCPVSTAILLEVEHPVNEYLREFRNGNKPQRPAPQKNWLIVYRPQGEVIRTALEHGEYAILKALSEGTTVNGAIERATALMPVAELEIAGKLQTWFARWITEGFI